MSLCNMVKSAKIQRNFSTSTRDTKTHDAGSVRLKSVWKIQAPLNLLTVKVEIALVHC